MKIKNKKIAILGGSFNPPGIHHRKIAQALSKKFDVVKIIPSGPRPDKATTNEIEPIHRAVMVDLTFKNLTKNVEIELFDLENATFTRAYDLEKQYGKEGKVWHIVGADLIQGGAKNSSDIQKNWYRGKELWKNSYFVVNLRSGFKIDKSDLPPHSIVLNIGLSGSSTTIRSKHFNRESVEGLVVPDVEQYIKRYGLYRGIPGVELTRYQLDEAQPLILADINNKKAVLIKKKLSSFSVLKNPNIIIVVGGDGFMLHSIRKYWRRRIPFFGINTGHKGFLMNDVAQSLQKKFFEQEFILRHAPLLVIDAENMEGKSQCILAFNDASMHVEHGKAGWFQVEVNGEIRLKKLVADGVLLATPAGSTAYAKSMGANPVPIGTDILVVVGSNVFEPTGWSHGANLSGNANITFSNIDKTGWRRIYGFTDGVPLGEIRKMHIRKSRIAAAEILFMENHDIQTKLDRLQFPNI